MRLMKTQQQKQEALKSEAESRKNGEMGQKE